MFERLFQFIRENLTRAIVGAVDDAQEEINARIEGREQPKRLNGTKTSRKKASK